jgi:hypothetical protein
VGYKVTEKGVLVDPPLSSALINAGFGTPRGQAVVLDDLEAVFLIFRGKLEVDNPEDTIRKLSARRKGFWTVYAVYADLCGQGKKLFYDGELGVVLQKEGEKIVYIPLSLDKPMTLKKVFSKSQRYVDGGWTPVLAIVDEHGTPTYYSVDTRPPSRELFGSHEGEG